MYRSAAFLGKEKLSEAPDSGAKSRAVFSAVVFASEEEERRCCTVHVSARIFYSPTLFSHPLQYPPTTPAPFSPLSGHAGIFGPFFGDFLCAPRRLFGNQEATQTTRVHRPRPARSEQTFAGERAQNESLRGDREVKGAEEVRARGGKGGGAAPISDG